MIESMNLSFENVSYQVSCGFLQNKRTKQVLKNIHGEFRSNELSALVGPSGSGKTSLLDVLSGYRCKNVRGCLKINQNAASPNVVRKVSSYVMQDNKLHRFLTTHETMMFAAKFKIRKNQNTEMKIQEIMESLGIEKKSDTLVKYLSGGEQKRLSIALELLDDPSILFLDEPTTGLDSSSSTQCVKLLKKLAEEGKTIICTIHSPSALIFGMFDHLYALADGCCIYQGSSRNLVSFLNDIDLVCPEAYNPSDFLLEIATNDYGLLNSKLTGKIQNGSNHEYRKIQKSENLLNRSEVVKLNTSSFISLPYVQQIRHLLHRNFIISTRDKTLILMRICIHVVIGVTFGAIYSNVGRDASKFLDNYRYIIASIVFQLYTSYYSLQTSIPLEFPIIKREHFNRWYSTKAFYTAFVLFDLPITLFCVFAYVSITYWMTDQPLEMTRFLAFFFVSLTLSYAAQGIGLVRSALLDVKTAAIFSGIFLAPFFTFSSATVLMKDTFNCFHWMFEMNFVDNAIKGSLQAIFGMNRSKLECSEMYCHYSYPSKILQEMEVSSSLERALFVLSIYAVLTRILSFILIRCRLKS